MPNILQAEITCIEEIAHDLRRIWFRPEAPLQDYVPGRYCTLEVGGVKRPYSIVSIDQGGIFELFIELVEDGELTPKLWRLNEGDRVGVFARVKGIFTLEKHFTNHLMVATVTGIVPFMSMLEAHLGDPSDENRFFIFYGASYENELAYHAQLTAWAEQYPDKLTYIATVSRPEEVRNAGWLPDPESGLITGRVNEILRDYILGCTTVFGEDIHCHSGVLYACGHPGMMEDVKEYFVPWGWDFKEEAFWKL